MLGVYFHYYVLIFSMRGCLSYEMIDCFLKPDIDEKMDIFHMKWKQDLFREII